MNSFFKTFVFFVALCLMSLFVFTPVSAETAGTNLIQNPSVESSSTSNLPNNWSKGGYGTNQRVFTYPVAGYNSDKGIKVEITSYSGGDAKWYSSDIPVTAGNTYTFSDYYISNVPSIVDVRYTMGDGSYKYFDIAFADANPGSSYKNLTADFVVPANVVSVSFFHLINKVGSLTTDNYSLTSAGVTPPPPPPTDPTNLIPNPGFEQAGSAGLPSSWNKGGYGTNSKSLSYPETSYDGSKAVKIAITSYTSGDAKWYFNPITVASGTYTYSDHYNSNLSSYITVQYQKTDGTYSYQDISILPKTSDTFANVSVDFSVPSGTKNITIFHLIKGVGFLTLDNIVLNLKNQSGGGGGGGDTNIFDTGAVTFRFDDGYISQYTNALPKLNSSGLKATFFIITDKLAGITNYINSSQLKEIYNNGHEIGSHGKTHLHLTQLTPAQQLTEIQGSRNDLLAMGINPVASFSYPFGEFDSLTEQIVKDSGYSDALSTLNGYSTAGSDKYQLKRQPIYNTTTISQIKALIDDAVKNKRWLILELHDIKVSSDLYSMTPDNFNQMVDYVVQKQIPVVTIAQGIKSM